MIAGTTSVPLRKIFVYGTLRKGFPANHYLNGANFIGALRVYGYSIRSFSRYPAMYKSDMYLSVYGEVWELPSGPIGDKILNDLDMYEGVKTKHYERVEVATASYGPVWAYIQGPPVAPYDYVCDGIWRGPIATHVQRLSPTYVINATLDAWVPDLAGEHQAYNAVKAGTLFPKDSSTTEVKQGHPSYTVASQQTFSQLTAPPISPRKLLVSRLYGEAKEAKNNEELKSNHLKLNHVKAI